MICISSPLRAAALVALTAALSSTLAAAQTLYRSVDATGRVTFSDLPPKDAKQLAPAGVAGNDHSANVTLPYELRAVVGKYPVTLYTSADCRPCDDGRSLLRARGVPYVEKTIATAEDAQTLKRLGNATSLPLLSVGTQNIKGFAASEWQQYLSFAGYPESSRLPAGYRAPAPTPLVDVPVSAPVATPASATTAPAPAQAVRQAPPPANPAGIRF